MKIGTVVEGPTDRLVLKAIIEKLYPGDHDYLDLQPADNGDSFGRSGTGWKGVRRFCFDVWQSLDTDITTLITDYQIDLLIIHADADIAFEPDLQEDTIHPVGNVSQPCPPILPTVENLKEVIARWLNLEGADKFPSEAILAIPAQDTENWLFAALFPDDALCRKSDYECIHKGDDHRHPAYLMTLKGYRKILKRKDGKIKKPVKRYRQVVGNVADNWNKVCEFCSQARTFNDKLMYKNIREARQEYARGEVRKGTVDDLMGELSE
ncbi:hypothetical protein QUF72_02525 [Desulfobacterales bacterium HSG2]|nr:hypothetical protein [Desulfobacterales bacterium HSG2]